MWYNTGMKDQMTYEEFLSALPYIDWYYMMADGGEAYRRGADQVRRYRAIAEENGWMAEYKAEQEKHKI